MMWLHSCASGLPAIAATTSKGGCIGDGSGDRYRGRKAAAAIAGFLRV